MNTSLSKTCWVCGGTIKKIVAEKLGTLVKELGLSVRANNCLHRASIEYVEQILLLDYYRILGMRGLGKKTLNEIHEKVNIFGFAWELPSEEQPNKCAVIDFCK